MGRRCEGPASIMCIGLGVTIGTVQVSRLLTMLLYTVVFSVTPLDHGWILEGLGSIRDFSCMTTTPGSEGNTPEYCCGICGGLQVEGD